MTVRVLTGQHPHLIPYFFPPLFQLPLFLHPLSIFSAVLHFCMHPTITTSVSLLTPFLLNNFLKFCCSSPPSCHLLSHFSGNSTQSFHSIGSTHTGGVSNKVESRTNWLNIIHWENATMNFLIYIAEEYNRSLLCSSAFNRHLAPSYVPIVRA